MLLMIISPLQCRKVSGRSTERKKNKQMKKTMVSPPQFLLLRPPMSEILSCVRKLIIRGLLTQFSFEY